MPSRDGVTLVSNPVKPIQSAIPATHTPTTDLSLGWLGMGLGINLVGLGMQEFYYGDGPA